MRVDKKNEEKKEIGGVKERENKRKREGGRKEKKKGFHFSLRFTETGPKVFVGAKGKVSPRLESYA